MALRRSASALAFTSASLSHWPCRRSEWPTIENVAPASFAIGAEMQPVCAPLSAAWTSSAPIGKDARAAAGAISVAGTAIATSTRGSSAAPIPSSSARLASDPFIFQFPATSLRRMSLPLRNHNHG